jgi:hypothetical protein
MIACLAPTSALSQNADVISLPAVPACDGDLAIVRVSEITPGGNMQQFLRVVDAHKAWYRSHGFANNEIYTAKILVQDDTTKTWKYSDTEIMVFHVRPPWTLKRDAAWDAYVQQYSDISNVKSLYITCLPKNH